MAWSVWRLAILVGAIMLVTALPREVAAQSANANLRGKAPPNAEVTAKNADTGFTRRIKAGDDGSYVLVGLPPGTYQVDAGPGTQQNVTLGVATTATLDFEGATQAAAAPEEIVVTAERLHEVRTSEVGGSISLRQIESTPQITRNFLEFADAVPGMQFSVDARGNTQIRSGTLNTGTTNVYIDGVGQKNYSRPSGITGQAGTSPDPRSGANQNTVGDPGNPFPQLAIAEYKVITSNYKAEYDQVSGAAITAVTRSGTNELEAGAFYTYTEADWRAETPAEKAAGTGKQGGDSKEYGFSLGGPIIQDRLHYFITYEAKDFTTPNTVVAPVILDTAGNEVDWTAGLTRNFGRTTARSPTRSTRTSTSPSSTGRSAMPIASSCRPGPGSRPASRRGRHIRRVRGIHLRQRRRSLRAALGAPGRALLQRGDGDVRRHRGRAVEDEQSARPAVRGPEHIRERLRSILLVDGVDPLSYFFTSQSGYSVQTTSPSPRSSGVASTRSRPASSSRTSS
jgi:hypothetical protein